MRTREQIKTVLTGIFFVSFPFIFGVPWPISRAIPHGHWLGGLVMFGMMIVGGVLIMLGVFKPDEYVTRVCPNCKVPTEQFVKKRSVSEKRKYWMCEKCRKSYSETWDFASASKALGRVQPIAKTETVAVTESRAQDKFCRECGAKIPRDSRYCEECGTRLA